MRAGLLGISVDRLVPVQEPSFPEAGWLTGWLQGCEAAWLSGCLAGWAEVDHELVEVRCGFAEVEYGLVGVGDGPVEVRRRCCLGSLQRG